MILEHHGQSCNTSENKEWTRHFLKNEEEVYVIIIKLRTNKYFSHLFKWLANEKESKKQSRVEGKTGWWEHGRPSKLVALEVGPTERTKRAAHSSTYPDKSKPRQIRGLFSFARKVFFLPTPYNHAHHQHALVRLSVDSPLQRLNLFLTFC